MITEIHKLLSYLRFERKSESYFQRNIAPKTELYLRQENEVFTVSLYIVTEVELIVKYNYGGRRIISREADHLGKFMVKDDYNFYTLLAQHGIKHI